MHYAPFDTYCTLEGPFGRVEVLDYSHDLVMHAHSQTQLTFWMGGGSAHAHVAGQRVAFGPAQAVGVNRLVSHDLCLDQADVPAVFLLLNIDDAFLGAYSVSASGQPVFPTAAVLLDVPLQRAAWQLMQKLLSPVRSAGFTIDADVRWLLTHTIAPPDAPVPGRALPRRHNMVDYRLRVAMAHMRDNLGRPTVAAELADVVGLSRSRLCALFHDEMGTTPHVFWNTIRLEAATRRLDADHENLTDLALDLGFSNSGNFSRFFREHTGVTPSAYRRYRHAA